MPSRFLRAFSLVCLAATAAASPVAAATWWRLPIWGADVRVFALDPFAPGHVFCGTSRGNFYGSSDGGSSWAPLRQGPAFPGYVVTALIADPKTPGRLWAALAGQYAGGLVVRSDDRGADWTILARWKEMVATRSLALVPGDPTVLAVGGDDGVRLSRDGGETWSRTGMETEGLLQVESLAFDPADARILYAGTWRQAFRTRDGGATWSRIAEGMVLDATIYTWDFAGSDPRDIWVSTCGWVYRTKDGGDHWTRFKNGFTNRRSHAVRRDPKRPSVIYAATVGGLHRSLDGGETWSRISRESLVVTALEVDRTTGRLYVGTEGEGVFVSDDGGATLSHGSVGLTEGRVSDLVADPNDPACLFLFRPALLARPGGTLVRARESAGRSRDRSLLRALLPARPRHDGRCFSGGRRGASVRADGRPGLARVRRASFGCCRHSSSGGSLGRGRLTLEWTELEQPPHRNPQRGHLPGRRGGNRRLLQLAAGSRRKARLGRGTTAAFRVEPARRSGAGDRRACAGRASLHRNDRRRPLPLRALTAPVVPPCRRGGPWGRPPLTMTPIGRDRETFRTP